ncbi:NAD-dependent epimerase/dehydratase family protein [Alphaproteobacteria bacterium]|nr:NAD-dependent epimerase/dehydratase family protein [Alphaproteobacteria bacterium]
MITIIGGSGFVGSSLARQLYERQCRFSISDLKRPAEFSEVSNILDIRSNADLNVKLNGKIVVNLAAVHRDDVANPNEYYSTNVDGARVLCQVCEEKGINKIVFTSSVAVYGFATPGTGENGSIDPFNEYGRTKALAEDVCREWRNRDPKNRSLIIVRPTVVFGEGNRGNVYNLLNQINSGAFAMIGSGENKKSMAYVENLSAFLVKCIESDEKYAVYNYVDTPDFTMNELVSLVRGKLRGKSSVGIRIPKFIGLMAGYTADLLAKLGVKLPISSIRVKKFCASSEFSSAKASLDGFVAPYTLREGLDRTLEAEFVNPDPDRQIFYTE